jgi:Proliferating cell nuclear antigen, N-terminal domain/Proliferating cell nuclear antigen, C-terminal domain
LPALPDLPPTQQQQQQQLVTTPTMAAPALRCVLEDIKALVTAVENVGQFRQVASVAFGGDGAAVTTVDDNHVMLIDLKMGRADFKEYSCPRPVTHHANLKAFATTMKLAVKRGEVTISAPAEDNPPLQVALESSSFTVQPKPVEGTYSALALEPPATIPDAVVTMATKEAKRIFKELLTFGDDVDVAFHGASGTCTLASAGHGGSASITLARDAHGVADIGGLGDLAQRFDAKYLHKVVKQDAGNKTLVLALRRGLPIEVRHGFGAESRLSYYLAPKATA